MKNLILILLFLISFIGCKESSDSSKNGAKKVHTLAGERRKMCACFDSQSDTGNWCPVGSTLKGSWFSKTCQSGNVEFEEYDHENECLLKECGCVCDKVVGYAKKWCPVGTMSFDDYCSKGDTKFSGGLGSKEECEKKHCTPNKRSKI